MLNLLIYLMIFGGSALMVYNIWGFIHFAKYLQAQKMWKRGIRILYMPIALLISFLIGYIIVGVFGKPDIVMASVLLGGSYFVYIIYKFLNSITEQIVESERLDAALLAAEESNRTKSNFMAMVSHEMRTPMNVILGLDTLALNEPDLSPQTEGYLKKIGASARMLLSLINNILDVNRIESGVLTNNPAPFCLQDVLEQMDAIAGTLGSQKNVSYERKSALPDKQRYMGDEVLLKKVLMALLDNAVKYTGAQGSVVFDVREIPQDKDNVQLQFTVSDTGIGIDPDYLPKIFEVFTREDSSSTATQGGSGLGLAVTKKIVEQMGGTITVTSRKNEGSVFTVSVPMQKMEPEAEEVPETQEEGYGLAGRRILLAEDIPENAEIVMDLLDLENVVCEHAENGKIAVDMFTRSEPGYYDAILMDLRMPEMDGLTATRTIRASAHPGAKSIPIIALTANAFAEDIKESLNAGMNAHLAKPADSDMLYHTLKKFIIRPA